MNTIINIIFDLSEVLISGLVGTGSTIAEEASVPREEVWGGRSGEHFDRLLTGHISEDEYLATTLTVTGWQMTPERLREVIRENMKRTVPDMIPLVRKLSSRHRLTLLSDHAREWVAFIESYHEFFDVFSSKFYSYELGSTKQDPTTFVRVMEALSARPQECLFIDDSEGNVERARALGIDGILFRNATDLVEELAQRGISTD